MKTMYRGWKVDLAVKNACSLTEDSRLFPRTYVGSLQLFVGSGQWDSTCFSDVYWHLQACGIWNSQPKYDLKTYKVNNLIYFIMVMES